MQYIKNLYTTRHTPHLPLLLSTICLILFFTIYGCGGGSGTKDIGSPTTLPPSITAGKATVQGTIFVPAGIEIAAGRLENAEDPLGSDLEIPKSVRQSSSIVNSAIDNPQSAVNTPHSTFRIPQSDRHGVLSLRSASAVGNDKPLPGAAVTVNKMKSNGTLEPVSGLTAKTDSNGNYTIPLVPEGENYILTASKKLIVNNSPVDISLKNVFSVDETDTQKGKKEDKVETNIATTLAAEAAKQSLIALNAGKSEAEKIELKDIPKEKIEKVKKNTILAIETDAVQVIPAVDTLKVLTQGPSAVSKELADLEKTSYGQQLKEVKNAMANDGSVRVKVVAEQGGGPLADAVVYLTVNGITYSKNTDNKGESFFENLTPESPVEVTAIKAGYQRRKENGNVSRPGRTNSIIIHLRPILTNQPPVANAGNDYSTVVGSFITLSAAMSYDPDGSRLTYQWSQLSGAAVSLSDANTATATFAPTQAGTYVFQLIVNDGTENSTPDTITITIFAHNTPPVATAGTTQTAAVGSTITLNGDASSDPDGDALTYQWKQISGPLVSLSKPASATPSFMPAEIGTYEFQLIVSDGKTNSLPDTVVIYVLDFSQPSNRPPIANAGTDINTIVNETVTLNGSSSSDSDGDALTYNWLQVAGPSVVLTNLATAKPTFIPTATGTYIFELVVNDSKLDSAGDKVTVYVTAVGENKIPIANAGIEQSVVINNKVTLDGSASSDPDGNAITYQWSQLSGTAVALSSTAASKTTFIPSVTGTYKFQLIVNDGKINSSPVIVIITVCSSACSSNIDCSDNNPLTSDTCSAPNTCQAACTHTICTPVCKSGADCNDNATSTLDICNTPNTCSANCSHPKITCSTNSDCNDNNALTIDTCNSGGTTSSACQHTAIACNTDMECNDNNALTVDTCTNGGTTNAVCSHTAIICNTDMECINRVNANQQSTPFCLNGGATSSVCIVCKADSNCNDNNALTLDTCTNANTSQSACSNVQITCNTNTDCNDNNSLTIDTCTNGGQINAACSHNSIPTASATAEPTTGIAPLKVKFTGNCTDTDGTCVSYQWNFGDGSATSTQQNPVYSYTKTGNYTAILTVTDDKNAVGTAAVKITVNEQTVCAAVLTCGSDGKIYSTPCSLPDNVTAVPMENCEPLNQNPTITSTATTTATVGTVYSYDVDATDADGDTLTYSLICPTCSTNPTINSTTGLISWTPTATGSYNTTVSVSDGSGGSASQSFTIAVSAANQAPIVSVSADKTSGIAPLTVNFTGACTDSDGTCVSYSWNFGDGNTATTLNPSHTYTSASTYTVTFTVTDNQGATNSTNLQISITADTTTPTTTDNWPDNWTSAQTVTVTLTPTDTGSGVQWTKYCVDTANTCTPTVTGTSVLVTCGSGLVCTQYVRYFSKDNSNNSETPQSKRVRQDLQLPTIIDNQTGDDTWYNSSVDFQSASHDIDFSDTGSLLATAQYTVWSRTNMSSGTGTEIIGWTNIATNINAASYTTNWSIPFSSLQDGITYVSVRVYDNVGAQNLVPTAAIATDVFYIKKDTSAPSAPSAVYDGSVLGVDTEVSTSVTQLSANWSASTDNESGITAYWIAIGTSAGATDVINWTYVGAIHELPLQATTVTGLSLTNGQIYYFSVKSVNGSSVQSVATTSDGVTVNVPSTPSTVSTGAHANSTAFNNARKLVRDSLGNLYLAYFKSDGSTDQIFVAKSTDNGNTWNDIGAAPIQTISGYYQRYPSIAIDSSDNLHCVWQGADSINTLYEQIKYSKCTMNCSSSTNWTAWTNIQTISGYYQWNPSIAIDSSNNLHVVWEGKDSGNLTSQIKYSKYSGGSWSIWTNIQTISGYGQQISSIAIDSSDNLHVVWEGTDSGNPSYWQIKYSKYSGGSWSIWTNIQTISGYHQYYPSIAIDSSNNLHVVWFGTDSGNLSWQIKYSKYFGGGWSVWTNIQTISGYDQRDPSIAIDSSDNLHVVWQGYDTGNPSYWQIKYSTCTTNCQTAANWIAWVNKTSSTSANQLEPNLRWSRWNNNGGNLMWGWTDGTTVMFDKDASVTMPNVSGTGDTTAPTTTDNWTDNWTSAQTVTVTLTPTDAGSGVQWTKYCVDTANTCTPTATGTSVLVTCASGLVCTQYVRYYSKDNAGNSETVKSNTVRQDLQLPVVIDNQTGDDTWYGTGMPVPYDVDFSDTGGSLLATAQYTVWSSIGIGTGTGTEIIGWTNIASGINAASYTTNWNVSFSSLQDGINYVSVRVYDTVGAQNFVPIAAIATDVFYIKKDTSAPSAPSAVNDGTGADIDVATSTTQLSANWSSSSDAESGIIAYWIAIGTTPGATDVTNWTDVGNVTTITVGASLGLPSLTNGQIYYFSVKAQNGSQITSAVTTSDGITVNISTTVSTSATWYSTGENNARRIVRNSAGNLYFAYHKDSGGVNQIYVTKSTDNGNTWSDMGGAPIQTISGYEQRYPSMAIDSQNNLHIVWRGSDIASSQQIKYSKYSGSSWSAWTNVQTISGLQDAPAIAVDSLDSLHVVWQGIDGGGNNQIKYSKYSGGSWSVWTNIQPISGYEQYAPSITADSQNNLHVVWYGIDSGGNYQVKYSKCTANCMNYANWSVWTNIQPISGYNQERVSLAIDSQDNLHVVWNGRDSGNTNDQIKYTKCNTNTANCANNTNWSAWTNIQTIGGYTQEWPTIALDSAGKVFVMWYGTDAGSTTYSQIKYSACSSNCSNSVNWSTWTNKTSNTTTNQYYPTFRWSRWNNNGGSLDWGWVDGTTVRFDKDASVTMPNVPGTGDTTAPTTTDNWTDNWTSAQTVTVTLTASDAGSGVQATYYCVDTANTCTPTATGTSVLVTCASGFVCTQYVRYYSKDNSNNTETTKSKTVRQDLHVASTVSTGAAEESTSRNSGRKLVKDNAGNLYFVYYKGSPSQIYVAKSTDNGNTWTDIGSAPIQTIFGYIQMQPSIAIDSSNNLHVVWYGYDNINAAQYQIKYSKYNGTSWSVWTNIQTISGYDQQLPSIAIDSLNNLHVMWDGIDSTNTINNQIKYSKYNGSAWSAWTNIQTVSGYSQWYPSIAIDSQDNLHVTWYGTDSGSGGYTQIKYSKYSGGNWSVWTNIQTTGYDQTSPSIAIDSLNNLHAVWYGKDSANTTYYQIKYSKYDGTSWSTWTNIQTLSGYHQLIPSIAIDSTDRIHTMWHGADSGSPTYTQVKYSSCTANCQTAVNWSAWVNKTSSTSANQQYPTFRWSRWNNNGGSLDWGWTDGTTVMFNKDPTVNMSP